MSHSHPLQDGGIECCDWLNHAALLAQGRLSGRPVWPVSQPVSPGVCSDTLTRLNLINPGHLHLYHFHLIEATTTTTTSFEPHCRFTTDHRRNRHVTILIVPYHPAAQQGILGRIASRLFLVQTSRTIVTPFFNFAMPQTSSKSRGNLHGQVETNATRRISFPSESVSSTRGLRIGCPR